MSIRKEFHKHYYLVTLLGKNATMNSVIYSLQLLLLLVVFRILYPKVRRLYQIPWSVYGSGGSSDISANASKSCHLVCINNHIKKWFCYKVKLQTNYLSLYDERQKSLKCFNQFFWQKMEEYIRGRNYLPWDILVPCLLVVHDAGNNGSYHTVHTRVNHHQPTPVW